MAVASAVVYYRMCRWEGAKMTLCRARVRKRRRVGLA